VLAALASACQPVGEAATLRERVTAELGEELGPSLSPGGAIAFSKLTSPANPDIYVVHEGEPPVNLTPDSPVNDVEPAFSPDGGSIAFRSARDGGGIFVMSASGGAARRVVQGPGWNPSWSPDGSQILFGRPSAAASPYGAATPAGGLWIVDAAGGEPRQITSAYGFSPQMSPDGGRVAYWALGDGTGAGAGGVQRDIWTVRIDGRGALKVTDDEAVDWSPVWGPDGRHLYFASDRDGAMQIWRVAIDPLTGVTTGEPEPVTGDEGAPIRGHLTVAGGALAYMDRSETRTLFRVSLPPDGTSSPPARVSDPSAISPAAVVGSPDGSMVAFTRGNVGQEDVFVMRSDGTDVRRLTDDPYRDRVPQWSPDGSRIAFRSDRPVADGSRPYRWYSVRPDGSDLQPLVEAGGTTLRWSPDGSRIAVHSAGSITLFGSDGSGRRVLVQPTPEAPVAVIVPVWSPDGHRLAWVETRGPDAALVAVDVTDGSEPRPLVRRRGTLSVPVWSPDGRRVASMAAGGEADGGTLVLDATGTATSPVRLAGMGFTPAAWSADGRTVMGTRPAEGGRPAAPVAYDFITRASELLADSGAGAQWTPDGRHVLVTTDAGTRLRLIDRATKTARELFSVTPPATFTFALGEDGRSVFTLVSEPQADIYRIGLPR
jgi:Tol biopolymer transport system component